MAGIHKMLVRITNMEDPDQTASSAVVLIWVCTVCLGTSVQNFRTFTVSTVWQIIRIYHECEGGIIRIYHECEGRIEKSVPKINNWHLKACRVMTNGDRGGRIFLSHPHNHDRFL